MHVFVFSSFLFYFKKKMLFINFILFFFSSNFVFILMWSSLTAEVVDKSLIGVFHFQPHTNWS